MKHSFIPLSLVAAAFSAAAVLTPAYAHDFRAGDLKIEHPWTRATPAGATAAAGYVIITNTGKTADVLTGATADGAGRVMLHQTTTDDAGVAHMEHVDGGVTIGAGETVKLVPGGTHIMLMDLTKAYSRGSMVQGSLTFKNAGTLPVEFKVESMGARAPSEVETTRSAPQNHSHHDHH